MMLTKVERKTVRIAANVEIRKSKGSAWVSWGDAQGHGKNEAEALADLATSTGEFLAGSLFPKYRWAGASLFVLYRHPCGWAYDIVHPGKTSPSSCLLDVKTEQAALEAMERHISQYIENVA